MPELPEVEVACRAIAPKLIGQTIDGATCRTPKLRAPLDPALDTLLRNRPIGIVTRRAKYLLIECLPAPGAALHARGWLILHLGMSGQLRLCATDTPLLAHDHFDLIFGQQLLRFNDPRRFGLVVWHPGPDPNEHPLLHKLGPEPFEARLDGDWLHQALAKKRGPIKPTLMDNHLLVGVGNIYASESLFRAGIAPHRAANRISQKRCTVLLTHLRQTLAEAIEAGGSSLRDYVHTDGSHGCFQLAHQVYERAGQPCVRCGTPIRQLRQAGRSTYYCPHCQH